MREHWNSHLSFILACVGAAVGLGNIWRFPYLCYRSGGGAFLIPYLVMLFLCGFPLFLMEQTLGQYTRRGPVGALERVCPIFKGAGVATVMISFWLCTYYNVIISWAFLYLKSSVQDPLPWSHCLNDWNTDKCRGTNHSAHHHHAYEESTISSTQEFYE